MLLDQLKELADDAREKAAAIVASQLRYQRSQRGAFGPPPVDWQGAFSALPAGFEREPSRDTKRETRVRSSADSVLSYFESRPGATRVLRYRQLHGIRSANAPERLTGEQKERASEIAREKGWSERQLYDFEQLLWEAEAYGGVEMEVEIEPY